MEILHNLRELEKDIQQLRTLILFESDSLFEKEPVLLREMGKILDSEKSLDGAIKAKKSFVHHQSSNNGG